MNVIRMRGKSPSLRQTHFVRGGDRNAGITLTLQPPGRRAQDQVLAVDTRLGAISGADEQGGDLSAIRRFDLVRSHYPNLRPAKQALWGYERRARHAGPISSKRRASDDGP